MTSITVHKEYLPYPVSTNNLSFTDGAKAGTFGYYATSAEVEHTANPYSRTLYEASPLNRVLKTAAPGDPWAMDTIANNDHTIKYAYQANTLNDAVKRLRAVATWELATGRYEVSTFVNDGNYPAGQLYKTITQDENKTGNVYTGSVTTSKLNTIEEYKNKQGQVVLKRNYNYKNSTLVYEILDTYYIYDQFGNLAFVIPPAATLSTSATNLNNYCYRYKYDSRNRLIEKKLPGKQWEYIVYDSQDRVVATGPALSPFGSPGSTPEQGWLITRYDAFGRVAYTGWKSTGTTAFSSAVRKTMQDATVALAVKSTSANTIDGISVNYSDALPAGTKLLTVNYYDNYVFPGSPAPPSGQIEGQDLLTNCKGLATASWVRALTTTSETFGETTYTFYDRKGRPVRTRTTNYLGGYTQTDTKMDFDGTPQYTITRHKRITASTEIITREDFTYTAQDRLLSHTHKINSLTPELMSKNEYTELGQLKNKKVGGPDVTAASYHQKVDYKYNVRGWLTDINDIDVPPNSTQNDLFAFTISYNTISDPVSTVEPLYNGNIAETYWRSSGDNNIRKYSYTYDKLNRMTGSYYQKPEDAVQLNNSYNEMLSYDKNGNILTLNRNGGLDDPNFVVEIDNLAYTYNGNQLLKVVDNSLSPQGFKDSSTNTADDFSYDAYGNMKIDNNKGITAITYNHLNLPVEIQFGGTTKKINYLYNAAGVKLKKTVTDTMNGLEVDYLGGFQYKGGVLQFFPTAEGYVDYTVWKSTGVFNYVYQYKDHLGNVRMDYTYVQPAPGVILEGLRIKEENHYYPFGLKHVNYNMDEYEYQESLENDGGVVFDPVIDPSSKLPNNYKYLGQERQDELGLNWDTFRHRNYDYAIGRFMCIDPIAEDFVDISTYQFAHNSPVWKVELEGLEGIPFQNLLKSAAKGVGNFFTNAVTGLKKEAVGLVNAYKNIPTNPKSTLKYVAEHSGPAILYKAAKSQLTKPINIIKKVVSGDTNGAVSAYTEHLTEGLLAWAGAGAFKGGAKSSTSSASTGETAAASAEAPVTNQIYSRPNNATTPAQRASVQGEPCVTCGETSTPMVADHKTPLVKEHYETGTINTESMRSLDAVQPQCTTCSAKQGAEMSQYSKEMKSIIQERTGQ